MEFTDIQQLLLKTRSQKKNIENELFKLKEKLNKVRREKNHLLRFVGKEKNAD